MSKSQRSWWYCGLALVALSGLVGCPSRSNPPPAAATPEQVASFLVTTPTSSAERVELGRQLVITNCRRCHGYPSPTEVTPAEWPAVVIKMCKRTSIPEADHALVLEYLLSVSR